MKFKSYEEYKIEKQDLIICGLILVLSLSMIFNFVFFVKVSDLNTEISVCENEIEGINKKEEL